MPSRTAHPGTRRAHMRKGKPVRAAPIRHPQAQRRRNQAGRQVRQGRKPLLWGAGIMAGWGALEAILGGRFFTAGLLFGLAGGFLVTHVAWEHHKRRKATRPARQSRPPVQQRQEALEKARAAHQPTLEQDLAAARARDEERNEALAKQRRYDEMQAMTGRQRKRGQPEMVWPEQYEEFYDEPGQLKPRPSGKPEPAGPKAGNGASNAPASHEEWQTLYGRRCDCTKCRAKRKAEKAEAVSLR